MPEPYDVVEKPLHLKHKHRKEEVFCEEKLSKPKKPGIVVTLNTRANLDFIIKHWKDFCIDGLKVYFVDLSGPNRKWVVTPAIHNRICEKSNLKKSLTSMSSSKKHTSTAKAGFFFPSSIKLR